MGETKSFFDYIKMINTGKIPKGDINTDKNYNQFMINRGFSFFKDTILVANLANKNYQMTNEMHFSFYKGLVKPRGRFNKWPKKDIEPRTKRLSEFLNISYKKAKDVVRFYPEEFFDQLETYDKEIKKTKS